MKISLLLTALILVGCANDPASKQAKIQHHYAGASTASLVLRRNQLQNELSRGGFHMKIGLIGDSGPDREGMGKEKNELEQELLRRYQAGDKEAHLSIFDQR